LRHPQVLQKIQSPRPRSLWTLVFSYFLLFFFVKHPRSSVSSTAPAENFLRVPFVLLVHAEEEVLVSLYPQGSQPRRCSAQHLLSCAYRIWRWGCVDLYPFHSVVLYYSCIQVDRWALSVAEHMHVVCLKPSGWKFGKKKKTPP